LAELERSERLELELRRQLKDRERVVEDLQQETEKRVGQIQVSCCEPCVRYRGVSLYFIIRAVRFIRDTFLAKLF